MLSTTGWSADVGVSVAYVTPNQHEARVRWAVFPANQVNAARPGISGKDLAAFRLGGTGSKAVLCGEAPISQVPLGCGVVRVIHATPGLRAQPLLWKPHLSFMSRASLCRKARSLSFSLDLS